MLEVSLEPVPASQFYFGLTSFVMSAPNNNSISTIGVPYTNRVRIPPPGCCAISLTASKVAKPIAIIGLMTALIAAYGGAGQSLLHSSM
jgi:hypothetical protein